MKSLLGEADFFKYMQAMEKPPVRGLRINPLKHANDAVRKVTGYLEPVPWEKDGYYYGEDLKPGQSPLHEAGMYYIQEPSAMSAAALLDPQPGERILDLCAAPGGKSTQIASKMQGRGLLVCNEPVMQRAKVLSSNIERMGIRNAVVCSALPKELEGVFPGCFDRILVDAPCSGEGMFRKNPESRSEWHAGSVLQCAQRQREILDSAAQMLRPCGTMVYSTCTFNRTENEENVAWFIQEHPEFECVPFELPRLPKAPEGFLHLFPHEIRGEGHFLCKFRKKEGEAARSGGAKGTHIRRVDMAALPQVFRFPVAPDRLYEKKGSIYLLPEYADAAVLERIRCLRPGLELCTASGRVWEPAHACAMALSPAEAAETADLSWEEMVSYQAGETVPSDGKKGWLLLCYKGVSLGWGKGADGRINNRYPKGLRKRQSGYGQSWNGEEE